jgi:hypothetical protein
MSFATGTISRIGVLITTTVMFSEAQVVQRVKLL